MRLIKVKPSVSNYTLAEVGDHGLYINVLSPVVHGNWVGIQRNNDEQRVCH